LAGVFNPASLSFSAPTILPGEVPAVLTFQLTVTDQFGTSAPDTVTVTVLPTADTLTATATWRPGLRRQGNRLNVTATSTAPTANLVVREVVAATGGVRNLGLMGPARPPVPGTFALTDKGAQAPSSIRINSNFGGRVTLQCGPPNANGRITCN
jgi:hypothetical protein